MLVFMDWNGIEFDLQVSDYQESESMYENETMNEVGLGVVALEVGRMKRQYQ